MVLSDSLNLQGMIENNTNKTFLKSLHKKWSFSLRISSHLLKKSVIKNLCSEVFNNIIICIQFIEV